MLVWQALKQVWHIGKEKEEGLDPLCLKVSGNFQYVSSGAPWKWQRKVLGREICGKCLEETDSDCPEQLLFYHLQHTGEFTDELHWWI